MSVIFESHEREFCAFSSAIRRGVDGARDATTPSERRARASEIESAVAECEAFIRRMDLEARSVGDASAKTTMLSKLRDYKSELATRKREARDASARGREEDARDALLGAAERGLGGVGSMEDGTANGAREMETTERLARTGERIRESQRSLAETEDLGVSILQDLQGQRETIQRSREALHGADDTIARSRKILSSMSRRATANKVYFYGVAGVLTVAILIIIFHRLAQK